MSTTIYDKLVSEMPPSLDKAMLRVMSYHGGRDHSIGGESLVAALFRQGYHVEKRQMRQCVHDLRRAGYLICSAPGEDGGYYMAETLAEFREFCDRELHPKAMDLLETESAMKEAARQLFGDAVQEAML